MPTINRSALNSNLRATESSLDKAGDKVGEAAGDLASRALKSAGKLVKPGVEIAGSAYVASHTIPYTMDAAAGKDVPFFNPHLSGTDRIAATGVFGVASAVAVLGVAHGAVKAIRILSDDAAKTAAASAAD